MFANLALINQPEFSPHISNLPWLQTPPFPKDFPVTSQVLWAMTSPIPRRSSTRWCASTRPKAPAPTPLAPWTPCRWGHVDTADTADTGPDPKRYRHKSACGELRQYICTYIYFCIYIYLYIYIYIFVYTYAFWRVMLFFLMFCFLLIFFRWVLLLLLSCIVIATCCYRYWHINIATFYIVVLTCCFGSIWSYACCVPVVISSCERWNPSTGGTEANSTVIPRKIEQGRSKTSTRNGRIMGS